MKNNLIFNHALLKKFFNTDQRVFKAKWRQFVNQHEEAIDEANSLVEIFNLISEDEESCEHLLDIYKRALTITVSSASAESIQLRDTNKNLFKNIKRRQTIELVVDLANFDKFFFVAIY